MFLFLYCLSSIETTQTVPEEQRKAIHLPSEKHLEMKQNTNGTKSINNFSKSEND